MPISTISGWKQQLLMRHRATIETVFYLTYTGLLLIDAFRELLPVTVLLFFLLKPPEKVMPLKAIGLQLILAFIALRCYQADIIPEAKFFVIYIFALHAGVLLTPIIARHAHWKYFAALAVIMGIIMIIRSQGIMLGFYIGTLELIHNYAEVVIISLLVKAYVSAEFDPLSKWTTAAVSLLSGAKFLMLNQLVMNLAQRWYPIVMAVIILGLLAVNPFHSFDSRFELFGLFFEHMNLQRFWLQTIQSVNDLVMTESTIYSFHDIWFDYIWNAGVVGIAAIFLHASLVYEILQQEQSVVRRNIIFMYIVCITFGFSVFCGSKYMFLMFGVMLASRPQKTLLPKAQVNFGASTA